MGVRVVEAKIRFELDGVSKSTKTSSTPAIAAWFPRPVARTLVMLRLSMPLGEDGLSRLFFLGGSQPVSCLV